MSFKLLKTIKVIVIIVFILAMVFAGYSIFKIAYSLPYKAPNVESIEFNISRPDDISYETLTEDINELFDNPKYILTYVDMTGDLKGRCYLLSHKIEIKKNLNYELYTFILTHELVHLTTYSIDERWTNLEAYNKLYNSDNDYFKNVALYIAYLDLHGAFSQDYSFVGYLVNF